jgi:YesN/AraC family two-component response regulator
LEKSDTHILVVDDEKMFRNLLFKTLQAKQYPVTVAADGEEALRLIEEKRFDLVISDLNMPRLGGIDLLKRVSKLSPDTAVIIITGFASLDTAIAALKEGAYDYITKPFQIEEILHAVERVREKISLVRQNRELMRQLEEAYLKIQSLLENKKGLSLELASVDSELQRQQKELLAGMFALKQYQNDVAQKKYLQPDLAEPSDLLLRVRDASRLRDQGKISEDEYKRIKSRLLK